MNLSISNLARPAEFSLDFLEELCLIGISGIELAPTHWWGMNANEYLSNARDLSRLLRRRGLSVSGLQSLLFGRPDLRLFDPRSWNELRKHLSLMIELSEKLGSEILVFGSPKNRLKGDLTLSDANVIAADFFASLVPKLEQAGVTLCLEPNSVAYGADYLVNFAEAVSLSDLIDSKRVRPQIDTGSMYLEREDIVKSISTGIFEHVHISMEYLAQPPGRLDHQAVAKALLDLGYEKWVVLEIINTDPRSENNFLSSGGWFYENYGLQRE